MKKNVYYVLFGILIVASIALFPKERTYEYHPIESNLIKVEITGEIYKPGYYLVSDGTTLGYLIELAGGLKETADISKLNLNEMIQKTDYHIGLFESKKDEPDIHKINLNQAKYDQLRSIPNITEERALNILLYKKEIGMYTKVDELLNVKGIGVVTFEKIKDYFTI